MSVRSRAVIRRVFGALVGAGVGIAIAAAGLQLGSALARTRRVAGTPALSLSRGDELLLFAVVILAIFATLAAHELGHLLGGRLVRFRAFLLVVGPLRLQKTLSGWTASLNRSLALAGGLAGSAPSDGDDLQRRMAVMIAGGPVTSLVTGVIAVAACLALDPFTFTAGTSRGLMMLATALCAYGVMSLGIGIVTLIPGHTSGFRTDGAQLLRLLRGGPGARRAAALAALVGLSLRGTRPRELPTALLDALDAPADASAEELYAWQFRQMVAADRGDVIEARALLGRIMAHADRLPAMTVPVLYYDAAAQYARFGDAEQARAMLRAAADRPAFGADYLRPLARGALATLDGEKATARAELARARALLPRSIGMGSTTTTEELIAELERRVS